MFPKFSIALAISLVSFVHGQTPAPSRTATLKLPDGVQIAAIIPTEPGQIGINPVDVPPESDIIAPIGVDTEYLTEIVTGGSTITSWHATTTDFGTATITTTGVDGQGTPTTIPKAFLVGVANGKVEITLSQWLKTKLASISSQLPSCAAAKRRDLELDLELEHALGDNASQIMRRAPPAAECVRLRTSRLNQLLREDPDVARQMVRLNEDIATATGNDAVVLAESDQMMAFADEDIVLEIIQVTEIEIVEVVSAGEILAAVGSAVLGVLGSLAFLVSSVNILEDLWKLKADPQPMPIFNTNPRPSTTQPANCPTATPACAGNRCKGNRFGQCGNEWKGCNCDPSSQQIADDNFWTAEGVDYDAVENLIYSWVFGPDQTDPQPAPDPKCDAGTSENPNLVNMEKSVFQQAVDTLCEDKNGLSGGITQTVKTSDLGISSFEGWSFDFSLDTTSNNDCTAYSCINVFGKFPSSCNYDSHTAFTTGEIDLDCGTAKYKIVDPDADTTPEKPKTPLTKGNQECYGSDDFGSHADIHKSWVQYYSGFACAGTALKTIKAGDSTTFIQWSTVTNDAPYQYNVFWKDGCELSTGQTEMYASNPLNEEDPGHTKCQDILIADYTQCNNGGVGGYISYGCLQYEFKAQKRS